MMCYSQAVPIAFVSTLYSTKIISSNAHVKGQGPFFVDLLTATHMTLTVHWEILL